MGYRASIALRCCLMGSTLAVLFYLLFLSRFPITAFAMGALSILECALLMRRIDRWNRVQSLFFEAVASQDFSQVPALPPGPSFEKLRRSYASAMEALRSQRQEQERRSRYLQTVADDIDAAIVVLDSRGRVDFSNRSFCALFGPPRRVEIASCLETARAMTNGERRTLRIGAGQEDLHLIVAARDFMMAQESFRLVTFQNVTRELEASELDAWQKIARVFNHEIMNSLTPISSLASTARGMLAGLVDTAQGTAADLERALRSIEKRSEGLQRFAESYRAFLRIPKPALTPILASDLLSRTRILLQGTLGEKRIDLRCHVPPLDLMLVADEALLEQVLINLVMNSVDACEDCKKPAILITAYRDDRQRPVIDVADNGRGIPPELRDRVFIPFFTTKTDGCGIGLSLCRQIMRLHGGTITVTSAADAPTVFSLRF